MSNQSTQENSAWLKSYFKEICKIPLLNKDQEVELARRIHAGDQEAFDKLIKANLRFVVKIAKKYKTQGLPIEDLVNEGNLGLIEAAKRFDETRGFKFISFAVWWIRQSIKKALTEQSRIVRIPLHRITDIGKVAQTYLQLAQEYSRNPSIYEVAEAMEQSVSKVSETLLSSRYSVSLENSHFEDDSLPLSETIKDNNQTAPDSTLEVDSMRKKIIEILDTLSPQQARIIKLSFGIEEERSYNIEEIASQLNLTKTRVRILKERALKRLKHSKRSRALREMLSN